MSYVMAEAMIDLRAKHDKLQTDVLEAFNKLEFKLDSIGVKIGTKVGEKAGKTFWQKFFSGGTTDIVKGLGIATGIQAMVKGVKNIMSGAINSFIEFEAEMASVKAKSNATEKEFYLLEKAARKMGESTYYNAIEAAQGLKILVEMGLDATEAIEALPKVITLATTENMNLADAADIALGSMRGMAMGTGELSRIVDGLAYTAAKSASTVYSLGQGLKVAGAAAHLSGQSLEDVLSVLGGLANQMIRSETAGFAITQMMARLTRVASTLKGTVDETGSTLGMARETMRSLDIELTKGGKTLRGLPEIFTKLKDKSLSTLEALRIFGVYTYKYALAAVNASDATNKLHSELTKVGGEAENAGQIMAAIKLDTLKGDVKLARNALVELGITIGSVFSPVSRGLVQAFTNTLQGLTDTIKEATGGTKKSVFDVGKESDPFGGFDITGVTNTEDDRLSQLIELGKERTKKWNAFAKDFSDSFWGRNRVKDLGDFGGFDVKIIDKKAMDKAYNDIMNKFSLIKYNEFGLPIVGDPKIITVTETDRALILDLSKSVEAENKIMDQLYSKQKIMSLNNLKYQLAELEEYNYKAENIINDRHDKEIAVLEDVENIRKSKNETDLEGTLEITKKIIAEEFKRVEKLKELRKLSSELSVEQISKFAESNTKKRLEEANKTSQNNARIAEAFTRLSEGMKQNSDEYFQWKLKALDAQKVKELAIVGDTEEGKYLVEKWYAEQRKQLHYQEVGRGTNLFGGAKVGFQKLADEGAMFGQIGEDWVFDLKSGFQSGFQTFFSDTLKGTKSWGEAIKGLFTDITGNILDSFAKAGSQLLANSLFNLLLSSLTTVYTPTFSGTSAGYPSLGGTPWYNKNLSSNIPIGKTFKKASSSSNDSMVLNQEIHYNISAIDGQSVHQFFRKNRKLVQEISADGVDKSRRLKKIYRGNNE